MNRAVRNLIAVVERNCDYRARGYIDLPPGTITDEVESELAVWGYAVAFSDRLWVGGYRLHSPESVRAGNYRLHVPPSIFTRASPGSAQVPDAGALDVEAILEERGEIPSN